MREERGEGGEGESSSFMGGAKQAHCNAHLYKYTCQLHDSNALNSTITYRGEGDGLAVLSCLPWDPTHHLVDSSVTSTVHVPIQGVELWRLVWSLLAVGRGEEGRKEEGERGREGEKEKGREGESG